MFSKSIISHPQTHHSNLFSPIKKITTKLSGHISFLPSRPRTAFTQRASNDMSLIENVKNYLLAAGILVVCLVGVHIFVPFLCVLRNDANDFEGDAREF